MRGSISCLAVAINPNQKNIALPVMRMRMLMLMLKFYTRNALACATTRTLPTPQCSPPLLKLQLQPFSLKFSSHPHSSSTLSYLINNFGFSPETAFKVSDKLHLHNHQKLDSVLAFFRTHGFSDSQIRDIIRRELWLLSCNPHKVLLPKFQFLLSKGAPTSDIVHMVSANPRLLHRSLHNHIIPAYELVRGFFQSDQRTITCMNHNASFLSDGRLAPNVKLLLDNGVTHSSIARLFHTRPRILCSFNLLKIVEELKELGFKSSTSTFSVALLAKTTVSKTRWTEKSEIFKKWGWSQEHILEAFKKQPYCMLSSTDKINAVMSFWVNELGFNSLHLVKAPGIFSYSLEKRIVPRASVVQFLISKGLRDKDVGVNQPFLITEKLFLEKFVKRFKEDSSHLLKLYEEKMNPANSREKAFTEYVTS